MSSASGPPTGDGDRLVAELLEELSAKLQAGQPIDVEACARAHPECAERLRRLLPAAQALAGLSRASGSGTAPSAPPAAPVTGTLGDFQILREVGRGGMGVVYEAEQISLGRRVALKVLPLAAVLDPRQLRRFQNEAKAAAQMHHPNIVPVYGVGSDRGVHYYAMQFIEGRTLAELIEERGARGAGRGVPAPSTVRGRKTPSTVKGDSRPAPPAPVPFLQEAARLGVAAAEALDYAHQHGIVHRDIKPANLMVDAEGRLWVTDFGLAHMQGEGGLTATGDLLGTLRYMSPEQALAKRGLVDHRTDVYSLGLTLYELLAGQPAFPGEDRRELLQRIAHEDPAPLRRLNPAVPADLETVLARATAKEPAERYATARELADDLRRFLEDRPVLARRPTVAQRLRKWARRHRALVGSLTLSAAVLLVGGVLGLAAFAVQQHDLADQRKRDAEKIAADKEAVERRLYRALLAEAGALRRERRPGYRREVWAALRDAYALKKVATDSGAAIRTEVLACLGDPIGLDAVRPETAVRQKPPVVPREPREFFVRTVPHMGKPAIWAMTPSGSHLAHVQVNGGVVWVLHNQGREVLLMAVQEQTFGAFHALKFTADGRTLVAGCEEGVVTWKVNVTLDQKLPVQTSFRAGTIHSIDVHPGGRLLATGGRELKLWSLTNHRLIATFPCKVPGARVEFSADGKLLLAVVGDKAVAAWPVSESPEKRSLDGHQAGVPAVAFSPDGKRLASASKDMTVRLWDVGSGRCRHTCHGHPAPIEAVAFSPDGKRLASGDIYGNVRIWDARSGRAVGELTGILIPAIPAKGIPAARSPGQIWRLQFTPTGTHLLASGGLGVVAWEVRPGVRPEDWVCVSATPPTQRPPPTFDVAVHPDGRTVVFVGRSLDGWGQLYRWDLRGEEGAFGLGVKAQFALRALHFDPAGKRLTFLTPAGTLGVLDWPGGKARDTGLKTHHLTLSPDGRSAAAANAEHEVVLYDFQTAREVLRLPPEDGDLWGLAWSREGRLAVGMSDGGVALWDLPEVRARLAEFDLPVPQLPLRRAAVPHRP